MSPLSKFSFRYLRTLCFIAGVFAACDVFANCNPGEYSVCNLDDQFGSTCECECTACPSGQTSDGTGQVNYCTNPPTGSSGCQSSGGGYGQKCAGFGDCPSGDIFNGKKCKTASGCPGGCAKYEICDINTGATGVTATGDCHIEGTSCIANTVNCSEFIIDVAFGEWTCAKNDQTGQADWKPERNAWDTKNCQCSVRNRNIEMDVASTQINCANANADYYVQEQNRYRTTSLNSTIAYNTSRRYCSQCYPGYLPSITSAAENGVFAYPSGGNGAWGAWRCNTMVHAPNYADGCIVKFTYSNGTGAINDSDCTKSCPAGSQTEQDGATGPDDCILDTSQTFSDNTGTFRLGPGQCSTGG